MAKRIKTVNKEMLKRPCAAAAAANASFLSVCLQNVLHGRQPGLRKGLRYCRTAPCLSGEPFSFYISYPLFYEKGSTFTVKTS